MKKIGLLIFIFTAAISSNCQNVGIGTSIPGQKLEVNGKIRVGNDNNSPAPGTLRWNANINDLELYDGTVWKSLTLSSQSLWGRSLIFENYNLAPGDLNSSDYFGYSVNVSGDYMVIGCPQDVIGNNVMQGSAYVYHKNGDNWIQQSKLIASDGAANENFGHSVSISGDYIIIGTPNDVVGSNVYQGSAYIFFRNGSTWSQQAKITASNGLGGDHFGNAVSISGDNCIVSAPNDQVGSNINQGSAYIFQRTGGTFWVQVAQLTANDGLSSDYFGASVSMDGLKAVIGSPFDDISSNPDQGSIYLFGKSGANWLQENKFSASDGDAYDELGHSVAIQGNTIVGGAPYHAVNLIQQGAAYVWRYNNVFWSFQSKLFQGSTTTQDYFGYSVSANGDHIVIGELAHNTSQGAAYLYLLSNNKYNLISKLEASSAASYEFFGLSVHMSQNHIVIGAPQKNTNDSGEAFIFSKNY